MLLSMAFVSTGKSAWGPPSASCLKFNIDASIKKCGDLIGLEVDAISIVAVINNVKLFNDVAAFVIDDIKCLCKDVGVQKCYSISSIPYERSKKAREPYKPLFDDAPTLRLTSRLWDQAYRS
ncbi:hypothetical protein JRO89_XS03G0102800 [Xanthoceras sorbifolium]|uniref:Uncharacterized protein n=1 Tax=Xanthoceras sorbifolium TaxID=99658 RepID=A0ABQ8I9E4_9ROSI|nr:hypothetical protein JRO89_XS03G0102800 [Xanthoceras sorbifolium]